MIDPIPLPGRLDHSIHEAVLEAVHEGVLVTSLEGEVEAMNERFREMWGIPERLSNDADAMLAHARERVEEPERFVAQVEEMYANPSDTFQHLIRLDDGRVIERRSVPRVQGDRVVGRVSTFTDVTAHRNAVTEALRGLSLYESILEATADGILVVDRHQHIATYNERFLELWGLDDGTVDGAHAPSLGDTMREMVAEPSNALEALDHPPETLQGDAQEVVDLGDHRRIEILSKPQIVGDQVIGRVWSFRDVTETKRARERLERSEMQFRGLFENAPVGLYRTTPEGEVLLANPALVDMLGYASAEDLLARNLEGSGSFEPGYSREAFRDRLEREGAVHGLESEWTLQDGSSLFVRESARAVSGEDGGILYYEGIVEDITERRRAEQQLQESQQHLEALVRNAPVILSSIDPDGTITFVAGSGLDRVELDPDEVIGRSIQDLYDPGTAPVTSFQRALEGEKATDTTEADGVWMQLVTVPIHGPDGEVERVLRVSMDITERKRAEQAIRRYADHLESEVQERTQELAEMNEALEEERARLEAIVETQGEIVRAPLSLEAVLNLVTERAQGLTDATGAVVELFDGEDLVYEAASGSVAEHVGLRLSPDASLSGECFRSGTPILCPDASEDPRVDQAAVKRIGVGSMLVVPLSYEGRTFGVIKVLSDEKDRFGPRDLSTMSLMAGLVAAAISHAQLFETQQRLIEERTQALDDLKRKSKEVEEFAHIVSHDLRAPLQTIDGFTQIVSEDHADALEPSARNLLSRVRQASQVMARQIDSLLSLSRVTRVPMEIETFDLSAVAEQVAADLSRRSGEHQPAVTIEEGMEARGDRALVETVLENLLGNAWKFTRTQPDARIEVSSRLEHGVRIYTVQDNGQGFEATYADKLFQPFQRLHSDEEVEGDGIGLASVQRAVERHGGEVWAEGKPGEGAAFHFTLEDGL